MPLRYWRAASQDLTAKVHTIIRTPLAQYYVNQAVKRGVARQQAQPGSVTFLQCFGGALNLHVSFVLSEGVYLDRTTQGLKPRFLKGEPPTDTDIAAVVQPISRRVIRKLRHLGYLEAGLDDAVATGYDPLLDDEPALARTLAASVTQRIAFGERAGQKVRRIGAGFGYEGERPTLTGPRCASVHGFSLHANTQVPAHRRDQLERLIRYTARGAVALARLAEAVNGDLVYTFTTPWSDGPLGSPSRRWNSWSSWRAGAAAAGPPGAVWGLCGAAQPPARRDHATPANRAWRSRGQPAAPHWSWARLLKRVFALDLATCPVCHQGALRIIAAITQAEVIQKMLRHLKRAADPPPIAPARSRQAALIGSPKGYPKL